MFLLVLVNYSIQISRSVFYKLATILTSYNHFDTHRQNLYNSTLIFNFLYYSHPHLINYYFDFNKRFLDS